MGEEYRKTLASLSVNQRNKFLQEDWNSYVMLLQLYEKNMESEPSFDAFCTKFCNSMVEKAKVDNKGDKAEEPYSWEKYVQLQLNDPQLEHNDQPVDEISSSSEDELDSKNEEKDLVDAIPQPVRICVDNKEPEGGNSKK